MAIISEDLVNKMVKIGFTVYESKTYLALLKHNPATGYEISREAGVPRSVIYSVLKKLENYGYVASIHGKPQRYIPLSPKQLLFNLETDFFQRINVLRESLYIFNDKSEDEGFWNLMGYNSLMQTCKSLIRTSNVSIYISGWKREIDMLYELILSAKKRGVDVVIFSFTEIDEKLGRVFSYGIDEEKLSKIWDHKLIVVVDSNDLVMGPANLKEEEQAIWTQNKAVMNIAINYIILDITLYGQRMGCNVSDTVVKLMNGDASFLDELIRESINKKKSN